MDEKLRTELARYAHDQAWAGWMKYLFSKCLNVVPEWEHVGGEGAVMIPGSFVKRWMRQADTPFDELPENERKSDYDEADKILAIFKDNLSP